MAKLWTSQGLEWPAPSVGRAPASSSIKCSDCGCAVDLEQLGTHVCASRAASEPTQAREGYQPRRDASPLLSQLSASAEEAKFRAKATGLKIVTSATQAGQAVRSFDMGRSPQITPRTPGDRLSPRPPAQRSASAGSSNVEEVAPVSPSMGHSLPFFDKYNRLYGAAHSPASSGSSFAPRSPSLLSSQPTSANRTTAFTSSNSPSQTCSSTGDFSGHHRNPSESSRCTSPEATAVFDISYDYADKEPHFDALRLGVNSQHYKPSRDPVSLPTQRERTISDGDSKPSAAKGFYKTSRSEPVSLAKLAQSSAKPQRGLRRLDDLLEDFDLSGEPDQHVPKAITADEEEEDFTAAYLLSGSPPSPVIFDFKKPPPRDEPTRPSPHLQRAMSAPRTVRCANCRRQVPREQSSTQQKPVELENGTSFCGACYAELYLPKCRKCTQPIQGKTASSRDGQVRGKFHPACFSCFECSTPFPTGEFFVHDEKPYCQKHYHQLAGTVCVTCHEGIEGACVSLGGGPISATRRYHPDCFVCSESRCRILLADYHFIVDEQPLCEKHAFERSVDSGQQNRKRPEKRKLSSCLDLVKSWTAPL